MTCSFLAKYLKFNFFNHQSSLLLGMWLVSFFTFSSSCDRFEGHRVRTTPAVLHPSSLKHELKGLDQKSNDLILQASGWIEPDPYPIRIPSLYDGVVKDVLVLEGENIRQGQKLVTLINEDAKLALNLAKAQLDEAKSIELELVSELSLHKLSLDKSKKEHQKAYTLLNEKLDYLKRLESLPNGSIPSFDLNKSRFEVERLQISYDAALMEVKFAEEQIQLMSQKLKSKQFNTEMKYTLFKKAELDLNRTEIFSPVDGRILNLLASPGNRLMQQMDTPEASTVAIVYKNEKLQARIDVPLAEASKLSIGQKVEISCSLLPNLKFNGQVTRIVGEADLQRNTLQVKVRILKPDEKLRPEMLCRAKFFSKSRTSKNPTSGDSLGVFIPVSLLTNENQKDAVLWIIGNDGKTAEQIKVKLGEEIINDYISVQEGIKAGDQIIINPPKSIKTGDRVTVINR